MLVAFLLFALTLLAIANGSHCNNKTEVELYNPRDHSFSHCWPAPDCHDGQEPSVRPGLSYPKDTDIECRKCPDGSFSNIKNNYTCQQCTVCLNKEVLLNCTPGRDTVCSNRCISSEFYFNVTDQQCYPCTECCGAYHGNIEPQCISLRIGEVIGEKGSLHCKMRSSQRCDKLFLKNNASSGTNRSTNNVPVVERLTKKCSWSLDNLHIGLICGVVSLTVVLVLMIGLWKRERERRSLRNDYLPSSQQCPLISNCLPGSASPTGGGCSGGCDIPCLEKLKVIPEEVKIDDIPYDVEELIIKLDAKRPHLKNWYDVGRKLGVSAEDLEQLKREDDREGGSPTRCLLSLLRTYEEIVSLRKFVHVLYDLRRSDIAKRICEFYKGNRNTAV